jgi:hypothetical protein
VAVSRQALPVFAACGVDAWGEVQDLRACPEVELVTTPRHAAVLLTGGTIPTDHLPALDRVHDQIPHPRTSVFWPAEDPSWGGPMKGLDDLVAALVEAGDRLAGDPSGSEPDRLPDEELNEWRGVGPNGQGGEGMMGGTPYGRPMAMTGDDRDGLALDQLRLRLGPFLDALPAGLTMEVTLQGEVVQACELHRSPPDETTSEHGPVPSRPRQRQVHPATDLLRHLAWALHLHGLDGLGARAARLAVASTGTDVDRSHLSRDLAALRRRIGRTGLLWGLRSVGPIEGRGDAAMRWKNRLETIAEAVETGDAPAADPLASLSVEALGRAIVGLSLTDAMTTIASVDLASVTRSVAAS